MKVVDANVLLYAVNEDAAHHVAARSWLDDALSGDETVAFTWLVLLAFIRLSTSRMVYDAPLATARALELVDLWLSAPAAIVVAPGPHHPSLLRIALMQAGSAGNVVNDAHLAAIAAEIRAGIVTFDRDFQRFTDVRVTVPA